MTSAPEVVSVCTIELDAEATRASTYARVLSVAELDRARRFRLAHVYAEFVVTRAVLRLLLAERMDCHARDLRIEVPAKGGKPYLHDEPGLQFSVSHTAGLAMVAYGRSGPVGVDVEALSAQVDVDSLAGRCLTGAELRDLQTLPGSLRRGGFLVAWTRKEAVLKAEGVGLSGDLRSVEVGFAQGPVAVPRRHSSWQLRDLDAGTRHVAALAVRADVAVAVHQSRWQGAPLVAASSR